jgi:plastocyanin
LTAQGLALISASAVKGFLITTLFALGTLPSLLAISVGAIKFMNKPKYAQGFMQFTAVILIFFALYNVNAQLNVLGLPSFGDVSLPSGTTKEENKNINSPSLREDGLPPVVEGKQVVKMEATGHDYRPKKFKVKAGIPIKWEIFDRGADGCTNAIIAEDLFGGEIKLKKGQTSVKEFTVQKPGRYKFSCWMGMVYGSFEVVK